MAVVNFNQSINLDIQMKMLRTKSQIFLDLSPNWGWDVILSRYKSNLTKLEFDEDEWDSDKHMNLKNLTQTKLVNKFSFLKPMLYYQLSELYQANAQSQKFKVVMDLFVQACKNRSPTRESFRSIFKQLSIDVKKNLDNVGDEWMYLTDIELVLGYNLNNPLSTEQKIEIAREWGKGDIHRGNNSEKYYADYREAVKLRFENISLSRIRNITVRDYILQVDNWMTDGSSRGIRMNVTDTQTGKVLKSRAKKQVIALTKTTDQLLENVITPYTSSESYSVSEKIEPGLKYRCIISAPYAQQIRLGYIEYVMGTNMLHCFPDVYFLQSQKTQEVICDNLVNFTAVNKRILKYLFFPLDASAFDQNVSHDEISIIFDELLNVIQARDPGLLVIPDQLPYIIELASRMWFDSDIIIDKTVNLGKWQHGVPSGVRWTAMIDSIVNACRFDVCKKWLSEDNEFGPAVIHYQMFQGDDMALILGRPIDTIRILKFYELTNIPVHPLKNFLSTTGNEFLRKIYYKGRQRAYPNRMVTKFLFRLPEKRGASTNSELMRERVTTMLHWCARHGNISYTITKIYNMFKKVYGNVSEDDVVSALTASSVNGGFGWIPPFGFRHKSIRAKDDIVYHVQWIEQDVKPPVEVAIQGVYLEQFNMLSETVAGHLPTSSLLNGLTSALNPSKVSNWSGKFRVQRKTNVKLTFGISLRVNLQSQLNTEFRPWMIDRKWNYPSTKDLLTHLRKRNNKASAIQLTDISLSYVASLMAQKTDDDVFWGWIQSTLPTPSFNFLSLNDLQRSRISKQIYQTYMTRLLRYKARIRMIDVIDICNLTHNYVSKNIHYFITQGYVKMMSD